MPEVNPARLPVPHLFMVVSIGFFALMMVSAFAPAQADGGATAATESGSAPAEASAWSTGCTGADASCAVGVTALAITAPLGRRELPSHRLAASGAVTVRGGGRRSVRPAPAGQQRADQDADGQ